MHVKGVLIQYKNFSLVCMAHACSSDQSLSGFGRSDERAKEGASVDKKGNGF